MNARDVKDLRLTVGIAFDDQGERGLVGVPGVCAMLLVWFRVGTHVVRSVLHFYE